MRPPISTANSTGLISFTRMEPLWDSQRNQLCVSICAIGQVGHQLQAILVESLLQNEEKMEIKLVTPREESNRSVGAEIRSRMVNWGLQDSFEHILKTIRSFVHLNIRTVYTYLPIDKKFICVVMLEFSFQLILSLKWIMDSELPHSKTKISLRGYPRSKGSLISYCWKPRIIEQKLTTNEKGCMYAPQTLKMLLHNLFRLNPIQICRQEADRYGTGKSTNIKNTLFSPQFWCLLARMKRSFARCPFTGSKSWLFHVTTSRVGIISRLFSVTNFLETTIRALPWVTQRYMFILSAGPAFRVSHNSPSPQEAMAAICAENHNESPRRAAIISRRRTHSQEILLGHMLSEGQPSIK